jgi:hypothetical protein
VLGNANLHEALSEAASEGALACAPHAIGCACNVRAICHGQGVGVNDLCLGRGFRIARAHGMVHVHEDSGHLVRPFGVAGCEARLGWEGV